MLRAFKYRIYPTKEQEILMSKMFGCVRFVFNWTLNEIKTAYEKDKTHLNYISLINRLPELKNEFEWLKEPGSQSLQYAIKCVHISYTNFFRTRKGYPKFKSKKSKQSCTFPSSKTCSHCGYVNSELKLSDREWTCPNCNSKLDRDLNAAINVKKVGLSIF